MEFIGRREELEFLERMWQTDSPHLIILYGKRRVGKTELALNFCRGKPHIYFLADQLPDNLQLRKLSQFVAQFFHDDFLERRGFGDWEDLFRYLKQKEHRIALVIDEFPYLVASQPAIPSIFQKGWDLYLKTCPVFLILCGSSVGIMEETTLAPKSPLYGRRTGQIQLRPFAFRDFAEIFPTRSFNERLTLYTILGGNIAYLNYFRGAGSIWKILTETVLTKEHSLFNEVEFLLREELKEPRNYFALLRALALGKTKLSEILNETGFDKGTASRYLAILNSLGITARQTPITEKNPEKSRRGIYHIEDMFFRFWFRFIFLNREYIEEGRKESVLSKIRENLLEVEAYAYETVASEIYRTIADQSERMPLFLQYGRWWDKNEEIDLVGINPEDNSILFAEVKWSKNPIGTNILKELQRKSVKVIWGKPGRKEYYCLMSKSGFTRDMTELGKSDDIFLFHGDRLV